MEGAVKTRTTIPATRIALAASDGAISRERTDGSNEK